MRDDLERYRAARMTRDKNYAEGYETGYRNFKLGAMLRLAREEAGLTQEQIARKLRTNKSAISRIERRADDIRLSTLQKYAKALGKRLSLEFR